MINYQYSLFLWSLQDLIWIVIICFICFAFSPFTTLDNRRFFLFKCGNIFWILELQSLIPDWEHYIDNSKLGFFPLSSLLLILSHPLYFPFICFLLPTFFFISVFASSYFWLRGLETRSSKNRYYIPVLF